MSKGLEYLRSGIETAMRALRPKPVMKVWEWVDKHVIVPLIVGSPYPGLMDTGRNPPMRDLFDLYWNPRIHSFTLCKSARVGGTLFAICCVLHKIATWPGPILWVDPTRKTGGRFSRAELQPYLLECEATRKKALVNKEMWTTLEMYFKDCSLGIVGTGSPAELGGRQAELLVLNECSKYRHVIDQEAPPAELAIVRTKQFRHTRKILKNSTPTHEGDYTWQGFLAGSQHYIYLPCPHCEKLQRLTFFSEEKEVPFDENLAPLPDGQTRVEKTGSIYFAHCKTGDRYNMDKVERETKYKCAHCEQLIDYEELPWMLRRRKIAAHNPGAMKSGEASAHYWAAYSPFEHWGQIAKKFLESRGNVGKLQDFYNSDLGLPFIRRATDIKETDIDLIIKASPEFHMGTLPRKPELLTMTVDVQGSGFWWSIRAWGIMFDHPELKTWSATIDCGFAVSWKQIEEMAGLTTKPNGQYHEYTYEGEGYRVLAGLIDSGFEAQRGKNVYDFCIKHSSVFSPSKGGTHQLRGRHVTTSPVADGQLELVWYHDDTFKQQLYYGLIKERRATWWLPRDIPDYYKAQLTAERTREVRQKNGTTKLEWEVVGPEGNHLGDTEKMHLVLEDTIEQRLDAVREEWLAANGEQTVEN